MNSEPGLHGLIREENEAGLESSAELSRGLSTFSRLDFCEHVVLAPVVVIDEPAPGQRKADTEECAHAHVTDAECEEHVSDQEDFQERSVWSEVLEESCAFCPCVHHDLLDIRPDAEQKSLPNSPANSRTEEALHFLGRVPLSDQESESGRDSGRRGGRREEKNVCRSDSPSRTEDFDESQLGVHQSLPETEGLSPAQRSARRGQRGKGARQRGRAEQRERICAMMAMSATGPCADACTEPADCNDVIDAEEVCTVESAVSVPEMCLEVQLLNEDAGASVASAQLAHVLGRLWKRRVSSRGLQNAVGSVGVQVHPKTQIELGWNGLHERKHGSLVGHVRFLQWVFRAVQLIVPGRWARGKVPMWVWLVLAICRRRRFTKCGMGKHLASEAEFSQQRDLAEEMLDWYGQYVAILRKWSSNVAPGIWDGFCGGGAVGEGIRRAGGVPHGMDLENQPAYRCRFSAEHFVCGDATDWSLVRSMQKRFGLDCAGASPPCKWYSTARQKGESSQPPLIAATRDMQKALFDWWWIENVMGAERHMNSEAVEVDGPFFGLRVFRSRLFESNFRLHVDQTVRVPADALRSRCCLGARNRWRSFDEFGRPYLSACCPGNVFIPIGTKPWRCTSEECAAAMDVDSGHMPYDRLAQAVPPAYSQWVFSQLCMQKAHSKYGVPVITFDEMKERPSWARRVLAQWLIGVGADRPDAGLSLRPRIMHQSDQTESGGGLTQRVAGALCIAGLREDVGLGTNQCSAPPQVPVRGPKVESPSCPVAHVAVDADVADAELTVCSSAVIGSLKPTRLDESTFRELYYSHFGGYCSQWSDDYDSSWLCKLRACETLSHSRLPTAVDLIGRNTFIEVSYPNFDAIQKVVLEAVRRGGRGTRATIVTQIGAAFDSAFERINCEATYGGSDALAPRRLAACWCGQRASPNRTSWLDHDAVDPYMDDQDRDGHVEDKAAKSILTWSPICHDPSLWRGKGLPADVESIMCEGVRIDMDADSSCFEVPQYPFPDSKALTESLFEADRALTVGHMEYVPDDKVEEVVKNHIVHPWLMVWQGKWRLCQDYSDGTNRAALSAPFGLPSAWDAKAALKPGSYMSKYDLRDFFWTIPVHAESRCRLVMRHPGTGRLMWCRALPFGYLDSPRQACRVSEALAGEMRKRAAGKGIHFICYVDDYLVIGDNLELTREGEKIFEEVMREFGMQWAPSKHRGPVQCIEFLGLLLSNVNGHRCIALSRKRQQKLRLMIDEWLQKRNSQGKELRVPPVELAKLLGHLVFASQVVPGGRTYMQNMLSAFKGFEVDWKHGMVRARQGKWELLPIPAEFWIDLEWWSDHLENRNCVSLEVPSYCEAMITGTDASDWGVGTVVWLDGHKEETNLEFVQAEKRRPINFRELLGIVRIVELYGHRLRGCKVMIETDNMAAKGAAEKLASTASSMQEMLRRLYAEAERWDIGIVPVHTPGAKLFRPDQTSRGDPIEEPRLRLAASVFRTFETRFGPFTEFVGAERRHAQCSFEEQDVACIWMHPAHNTVGSALRLLGRRLAGFDGDDGSNRGPPPKGIVIVPFTPDAQWWGLTRHFACVGRWEAGSRHLEMNQLGIWKPVVAKRSSLALVFPRVLGAVMRKVELDISSSSALESGYVRSADRPGRGAVLPLAAGSYVYSPGLKGTRGELLMVWHAFCPEVAGREVDEENELRVSCAELLLVKKKSRSTTYRLDRRSVDVGGSFAPGRRQVAWELAAGLLFTVDHLVQVDAPVETDEVASPRLVVAEVEARTFTFDYVRAEREIEKLTKCLMASGNFVGPGTLAGEFSSLDLVDEGDGQEAIDELGAARASADEAAAMRKKRIPAPQGQAVLKKAAPAIGGRKRTVCRYSAQYCEGCNEKFRFGEEIVAGFRSMIHPTDECLLEAGVAGGGFITVERRARRGAGG